MLRRISVRGVGIGGMVAVVALLAAACGGSTTPAATGTTTTTVAATTTAAPTTAAPTTTAAATSAPSTAAAVIKTASGPAGIWLTDQTGRTLYIFTKDVGSKSACNAGCESNWPPFTATGPVTVNGQFLSASLVGSSARGDGSTQVTYGGKPLYYFSGDTTPGQTKGQGVGGVWFILGPRANIMR